MVGLLNYLYYPVLGRLMEPEAFGEVQALVSLFLQVSIFLMVMGLTTINIIVNHKNAQQRNRIVLELEKLALFVSVVLLVGAVFFGSMLKTFFNFESWVPFVMLGLAVVVTVPFTFRSAVLRAKQRFGLNSWAWIVGAGMKLIFSVIFVAIGWGTTGAIAGIVIAQLLAFAYAAHYAKKHGFSESLRGELIRLPDMKLIWPELKYALLVLVGSLTITLLYSVDIMVVKRYFDPTTAGLYAGIAAVARIIFFLTASITQVLMPSVRLDRSGQENGQVLLKSLLLLGVIGGGAWGFFWLFPQFTIGTLMGDSYLVHADLLPRLGLVVYIVSILNLFVIYLVALRKYAVMWISLLTTGVTFALIAASHDTLVAIINNLLYGSLTMAALLIAWWIGFGNKKTTAYTFVTSLDFLSAERSKRYLAYRGEHRKKKIQNRPNV